MQFLKGLKYLHMKKFMHRDIKPANLLVTEKGVLKVADFNLSRKHNKMIFLSNVYSPDMVTQW